MDAIFMPKHLIWQILQCADILSLIMHFHTRNVYCGVVRTVNTSIFLNIIGRCTAHGIISSKDNKICYIFKQKSSRDKSTKIYTKKELVMMETKISGFYTSFYIPYIQRLSFHLPHVRILGTNHCGEM